MDILSINTGAHLKKGRTGVHVAPTTVEDYRRQKKQHGKAVNTAYTLAKEHMRAGRKVQALIARARLWYLEFISELRYGGRFAPPL